MGVDGNDSNMRGSIVSQYRMVDIREHVLMYMYPVAVPSAIPFHLHLFTITVMYQQENKKTLPEKLEYCGFKGNSY